MPTSGYFSETVPFSDSVENQNHIQKKFIDPRGEIACVKGAPNQSPSNGTFLMVSYVK